MSCEISALSLASLLLVAHAAAQTPVALTVIPGTVSLSANELTQVSVVANVTVPVHNLVLTAHSQPGAAVTIRTKGLDLTAVPGGTVRWLVWVRKLDDGRPASSIDFEAGFEYTGGAGGPAGLSSVANAALSITLKEPAKPAEVASATVQIASGSLLERRPKQGYLAVGNLTDVPVQLTGIAVSLPRFAQLTKPAGPAKENQKQSDPEAFPFEGNSYRISIAKEKAVILPGQQQVFEFSVYIPEFGAVESGKSLAVFKVDIAYRKNGYKATSTLLASQELDADVLGQTEFVGPLGISFLILPGFVALFLFSVLWSKVWPRRPFAFDFKQPPTYVFGILISIATVLIYPAVSTPLYRWLWGAKVARRDYLLGYSFSDIVNVWALSSAAPLAGWMLIGSCYLGVKKILAYILSQRVPTPQDQPREVLRRLKLAKKGLSLPQVAVAGVPFWELPLPSPEPSKNWVTGRVNVTVAPGDVVAYETARGHGDGDLFKFFDDHPLVGLSWSQGRGPRLAEAAAIARPDGQGDTFLNLN
jgi:hypothetical protein